MAKNLSERIFQLRRKQQAHGGFSLKMRSGGGENPRGLAFSIQPQALGFTMRSMAGSTRRKAILETIGYTTRTSVGSGRGQAYTGMPKDIAFSFRQIRTLGYTTMQATRVFTSTRIPPE